MESALALFYFSDSSWICRRLPGLDLIIESCHEKGLTGCLFGWMYGACDPQDQSITVAAGWVDTGKNVFYTAAYARPWRMHGWGEAHAICKENLCA
jgi:hypothetical protein